jgi:hypothetical protein
MNKNDLKVYEAPRMEIVQGESEGFICASFNQGQGKWVFGAREAGDEMSEIDDSKD